MAVSLATGLFRRVIMTWSPSTTASSNLLISFLACCTLTRSIVLPLNILRVIFSVFTCKMYMSMSHSKRNRSGLHYCINCMINHGNQYKNGWSHGVRSYKIILPLRKNTTELYCQFLKPDRLEQIIPIKDLCLAILPIVDELVAHNHLIGWMDQPILLYTMFFI